MLRTTLAGLRSRPMRLALSSLAIALGVAFVAGTLIMGASMNQAFFNGFAAGARNVSAAVSPAPAGSGSKPAGAPDAPSVPPSVLGQVRAVPGVASAGGRVLGQAPLAGADGKVITNAGSGGLGINVATDPALRGFTLASGHVPASPDQVVVDTATAADEHFRLGQTVRVVDHSDTMRSFTLVGTADFGADHQYGNASVTGFETPVAFQVTGRPGYDQVVARAAPGVSQAALVARIRALPGLSGYHVQTGSQLATSEADAAVQFTQQFTTAVLIFALIALAVAAIVIYNTFMILTAQRRRELALLRCAGATRRQVFAGTLAESLVVGAVASAAGLLAGLGLGWGLQRLFAAFGAGVPSGAVVLSPSTVLISMVTGVVATVAAAAIPARSATRVPPVAALGGQAEAPVTRRIGWLRLAVAVVFGGAGVALAYAGQQHVSGRSGFLEVAAGGGVFFIAVLALGPVIVPPVTRFFGWLPGVLFGVPARLAAVNARRNPHRVATTTAALTIGVTLMTVLTVVFSSAAASTTETISQHYPFDYVVQAGAGGRGAHEGAGNRTVPPRVVNALASSPALSIVAPVYQQRSSVNGATASTWAVGHSALGASYKPPVISGSLTAVGPGTVAVDESRLARLGTHQGGTVSVSTPDAGTETLRVAAVFSGGNGPVPDVLMSVPDFLRGFRPAGADMVYVNAAHGVSTAVSRAAVDRATAGDPLITVNTIADYKNELNSSVNRVLALFGALLGLALLIALLGITNTLSLSVIERTRESALLRALGLTRRGLRRMLLTEAVLMALLGVALGAALGAGFGWAMVRAFIKSTGGEGVLSIPYGRLAIYVAVAACVAALAAVIPARRAARAPIASALADT